MPPRTNYETTPSPMDRVQRRLGAGLTPQAITVTQRAADEGRMALWADLLDEVRQGDPHLHGDLQKRELSVAGADYELRLPTSAGKRAGANALALCNDAIEAIAPPAGSLAVSFRGLMQNLLTANWHGRAAVELVYSRDGRYTIPVEAYPIHARRLSWSNDLDWRLYLYDETTGDTRFSRFPGVPFSDRALFPAGKILLHTPRLFGTYPTREGLGRALVWYSAFKRWTVRDWLAFAEWAGRGLRVGKYATGRDAKNDRRANEEDKAALEDALVAMSSTVATIIPDVTDLQVIPPHSTEVHADLVKLCNGEMSKAILGGTLTSDPGDRGARSLGEVHLRAMTQLLKSDAENLSDTLRRDLFAPLVRMNLGDRAPVPHIVLNVEPPADAKSRAERLKLYMEHGLSVGAEWVRDMEGIPSPQPGEEVIGGRPTAAPAQLPPTATDPTDTGE